MKKFEGKSYDVLLYKGSQHTSVLNSVAHELYLKSIGYIALKIEGFDSVGKLELYKVNETPVNNRK